jgi:hypothetical protein
MARLPFSIFEGVPRLLALLLAVLAWLAPARARADGAPEPSLQTAAESLFLEGRKLLQAGQIEEACQRFADSRRIDPAVGTTMNLARCYLKLGRTASAWLLYRDSAAQARALGQTDREQHALNELAQLEPELAKLQIELEPKLKQEPSLEVLVDGSALPLSAVGTELPVDPGEHEVLVQADEHPLFSKSIAAEPRHTARVVVPHLVWERHDPRAAKAHTAPPKSSPWLTPRRGAALAFAGAALLGASFAVYETLRAVDDNKHSDPDTCVAGGVCTQSAIERRESAFEHARLANVAAVASGASLLGAGILWFYGTPVPAADSPRPTGFAWQVGYQRRF